VGAKATTLYSAKMLRLIVLACLAAAVTAKQEHCCSAADRHTVQAQWDELWHDVESSKLKIGFGKLSLLALVKKHPELHDALTAVDVDHPDSGAFQVYSLRFLHAFDNVITALDEPDALEFTLEHLANRFSSIKGITFEHFKSLGHILDHGFSRLADNYDPMAWKACFRGIFQKVASKIKH